MGLRGDRDLPQIPPWHYAFLIGRHGAGGTARVHYLFCWKENRAQKECSTPSRALVVLSLLDRDREPPADGFHQPIRRAPVSALQRSLVRLGHHVHLRSSFVGIACFRAWDTGYLTFGVGGSRRRAAYLSAGCDILSRVPGPAVGSARHGTPARIGTPRFAHLWRGEPPA